MTIRQVHIDRSKHTPLPGRLQDIDGRLQYRNSRIPLTLFLPINSLIIECFSQKCTATVQRSMVRAITDHLSVRTKGILHPVQIIIALGFVRQQDIKTYTILHLQTLSGKDIYHLLRSFRHRILINSQYGISQKHFLIRFSGRPTGTTARPS